MAKCKLTHSFLDRVAPGTKRVRHWDTEVSGFFASVLPSGRITFYFKYRYEGQQREFQLGVYGNLTAQQARRLAVKTAGEVAAGRDPQSEKKQRRSERLRQRQATLRVFISEVYGPYLLTESKSGRATLSRIRTCFEDWYRLPMTDITAFKVMRWRQDEIKRGLSNSTINRSVAILKACLNQAERADVISRNPLRQLKRLKEEKRNETPYLSQDQDMALRSALARRDQLRSLERRRANCWREERKYPLYPDIPEEMYSDYFTPLVLLALNTGMRRGELFKLRWDHVGDDYRRLIVVASNAKSRATRYIPLNVEARALLRKWRNCRTESSLVFPNPRTGRQLTDIKRAWDSIRRAAGIPGFRFHWLRHNFASQLVMKGVDLSRVRLLLGHSDLNMTLRYAHLAPSHLDDAVAVLDRSAR